MDIPWSIWILLGGPPAALAAAAVLRAVKPEWTHGPALLSCAAVVAAAADLVSRAYGGWGLDGPVYTWMEVGDWTLAFGVRLDGIGAAILGMVAPVGALIHVYAGGYMRGDPGFSRFFMVFHLFYWSMIGLLLSNNFVQFYLFWELMGLCSYLLIGFWMHKAEARAAALQAFLVNRIGDAALLGAAALIMAVFGTTRFAAVFRDLGQVSSPLVTVAAALLVVAAAAKSAQLPLYFWLPDAMAGPTPVSALMHAATMVTAGIVLLVRSWPLVESVSDLPAAIGGLGAATAVFAGVLACLQTDLKRLLAYSTVSHLGLMALALGLGRVGAAVLHLVMHGFFKAALFLCAGNIAHGLGRSTAGLAEVGGLRRRLPLTFACAAAGAVSLAGLFPAAGFFSKDQILDAALHAGPFWALSAIAAAFLGAAYSGRFVFGVFLGPERASHPQEAEVGMAIPVAALALGALAAGGLSGGIGRLLQSGSLIAPEYLALVGFSWKAFGFGTGAAGLGIAAAWSLSLARPGWDMEWRKSRPELAALIADDFGWRRAVAAAGGLARGAASWVGDVVDSRWVDGALEGGARAALAVSRAAAMGRGLINEYLWWAVLAAAAVLASAWT